MVCKYCYGENADVFIGTTARSNAIVDYEKYIHKTFYPFIIHPYSRFCVFWEAYFVVHIILRVTIICYIWAVVYHKNFTYQIIVFTFQAINAIDIIVMFFMGYVESSTGNVILEPKKIALRYLTRFFIFDLIATIPFDLIFFFTNTEVFQSTDSCWFYSPASFLCSLARFPVFTLRLLNLSKTLLWDHILIGMIIVCVFMYVTILFSANFYLCAMEKFYFQKFRVRRSVTYFIPVPKLQRFNTYFSILLLIILDCLFFDIKFIVENDFIKCVVLNLTFIGSSLFTTYFINYVIMHMKNHEKFCFDVESQVRTFITIRNFSSTLKNKTILYFHILFENKHTKDEEIFNYIPDTFTGDIFYRLCLPLLKNFYCFEDLPTFVLRRLAESMSYQLYLPNELVMSTEEPALRMYFVQRGTVALYSSKGSELYHFEAGSNFNGRNFLFGETINNKYAISIEVTEVYRLDHEDFMEIMSAFPKQFEKMNDKLRRVRKDSSYLAE